MTVMGADKQAATGGPVLDRQFLQELSSGDIDFEREMLSLFLESAGAYLADMRAAIARSEWADIAHKFKGASMAVGARRTSEAVAAAEKIPAEALDGRRLAIEMVERELNHLKEAMKGF